MKSFKELFIENTISEDAGQTINYKLQSTVYFGEANVNLVVSVKYNNINIKASADDFKELTYDALIKYFKQIGLELKSKLNVICNIRKGVGFTLGDIVVEFKANNKDMSLAEFNKLIEAKLQNVLDKEVKDKSLAKGIH